MTREEFAALQPEQAARSLFRGILDHYNPGDVVRALERGACPLSRTIDGKPRRFTDLAELTVEGAASWYAELAGINNGEAVIKAIVGLWEAHVLEAIDGILEELDRLEKEAV